MSERGIHTGRRAVCATAALALGVAAPVSHRYALLIPAAATAMLAVARWRGQPLLAPAGPVARYARRRRHAAHPDGLFPLLCPGATVDGLDVDGVTVGAIRDGYGLVALLELGDHRSTVHTGPVRAPAPAGLCTPASPTGPPVTAQTLVVTRGPYRRVFTVLRAGGEGEAWRDARLREALASAVRRASRRLARLGTLGRPLDPRAAAAAVVWSVDAVPGTVPAEITEEWDHLRIGAMLHATLRVHPRAAATTTDLLVRLLRAPATTVAVAATPAGATVRLSAPTPAALAAAVATLLSDLPGVLTPRDGDQYPGLRATLPLATVPAPPHALLTGWRTAAPRTGAGGPGSTGAGPVEPAGSGAAPTRPGATASGPGAGVRVPTQRDGGPSADPAVTAVPPGGVLIGVDRAGRPVHLRLDQDRTAPVRVAVVGGPAAARVLGGRLRALAGAGALPLVPVAVSVFDPPTAADAAALSSADVVICQPLPAAEAAMVAAALHLTRAGSWLSRIDGDMVAVISDGVVRWARLAASAAPAGSEQRSHPGLAGVAGP